MHEDEAHDGSIECHDVAAVHAVAPLDVGALDTVDAVEELRDLDLGGSHLVRVALAHREIAVGNGDLNVRILSLTGVGGDLLVEETAVVLTQASGTLTRGQGDAEGARGAARGHPDGKVVLLYIERHILRPPRFT